MKPVCNNPRGFTLIEVLVAAGLLGVLVLVLSSALQQGFLGFKSVDNRQSMASQFAEMRMKLGKRNICTGNLKDKVVNLGNEMILNRLDNFDISLNPTGEILFDQTVENTKDIGIVVAKLTLTPKTKLSKNFLIGEVRIHYQSKGKSLGPDQMSRTFSLALSVNDADNKIVNCGALDETVVAEDRICSVASNGRNYFDPVSGTCKSRYVDQCFMGSGSSASCPSGWTIAPAISQTCASTGSDSFSPVNRSYTDGAVIPFTPPPYRFVPSASGNSGTCAWAADQDYSGWTCGVRCEQLVYF